MNRILFPVCPLVLAFVLACTLVTAAQDVEPVRLLTPQTDGGRPFMQVLGDRSSRRAFSSQELSGQMLSNLLWAAFGVNRQDSGKRTAPSAVNWQEIDIYVALAQGLYLYDAPEHILKPVLAEDIRALTGRQPFTQDAPVNLIYVADRSRMGWAGDEDKDFYSAVDTGFISQNVYLFCASEGLATVVLGMVDKPVLAEKMGLRSDQQIMLTQPVGYLKK